jgi:hypothetical protein
MQALTGQDDLECFEDVLKYVTDKKKVLVTTPHLEGQFTRQEVNVRAVMLIPQKDGYLNLWTIAELAYPGCSVGMRLKK